LRRKAGFLIPIEVAILEAAVALLEAGQAEVHGYELAKVVQGIREATRLTAYGTLYKALARLEREGFLASRWEDPSQAAADGRPRRRFYRLTLEGQGALAEARSSAAATRTSRAAAAAVR
jgi:DNA-binding PadR family transcriptional regulator